MVDSNACHVPDDHLLLNFPEAQNWESAGGIVVLMMTTYLYTSHINLNINGSSKILR